MIFPRWGSLNEQCRKGCRYLSDVIPMQIVTFDGGWGFANLPDQSLFGWTTDPSSRIPTIVISTHLMLNKYTENFPSFLYLSENELPSEKN